MGRDTLPVGWAATTLDEFTSARSKSITPAKFPTETFELYSVPSYDSGTPEYTVGSEIGSSKQIVKPGSVLLCKINPRINRSWIVAERNSGQQIASTEWIVFPKTVAVEPEFLRLFLRRNIVRDFLAHNASGVGGSLMRVKKSTLKGFLAPIAPLNEQHRIVEKIDTLFARLDKGEEALRDVQKGLTRYRQSVLKAAVTGELTRDWRARNANQLEHGRDLLGRILQVRRDNWQGRGKYKEPVAPDTADLPELPEGWVWASFEQLFDVFGGATPSRRKPENWDGDIPWVSSGEVAFCRVGETKEHITQTGYDSCSTKLHPAGTILLAMIGEGKTRGQAAILDIPACNNQNAAAIRVSESGLPPEYVYYFLMGRYEQSRKEGQGGNQPALNGTKVKGFVMPLPSQDEAQEIAARIDIAFSMSAVLDVSCQTELARSQALRQSILKDAFAGRLVPQDPTDEPAGELLARIRGERDAGEPGSRRRRTRETA